MSRNTLAFEATRYELIEVAQGKRQAEMYIQGGKVVNVYSGEILPMNVAIYKDRIAYVGMSHASVGEKTKVIDATNQWVAPGFIEPHAHPWVIYNPVSLVQKVLPLGTTTIVHDNLFFYLHLGAREFLHMVKDLRQIPGVNLWLARLLSQADYEGERDDFTQESIRMLLDQPDVIGTAEVTRWPLLYEADPFLIDTVEYAKKLGKISDGHTSGCSYERLNSIVNSGISACHEAITAQEVLDRLRLGLWTTLRNSSLRPDLPEIAKAVTEHGVGTHRMLMTTDGPHPGFIQEHGFVDGLLRTAVRAGIPAVQAVQMATLNAATYLGLDDCLGGIAPGKRADVLILPDLQEFRPEVVVTGGQLVAINGRLLTSMQHIDFDSYPEQRPILIGEDVLSDPSLYTYAVDSEVNSASVPVIQFKIAVITSRKDITVPVREGRIDLKEYPGFIYCALVDRQGEWVSHAVLGNFLDHIEGMASTYNTTTHILAMGRNPVAMAQAAVRVKQMGGGIVIIENGAPILEIPLPFTGMMTKSPSFATAVEFEHSLFECVKEHGYPFHDILYSLLFLTCDSLPGLRVTSKGLLDVKTKKVLHSPRLLRRNMAYESVK